MKDIEQLRQIISKNTLSEEQQSEVQELLTKMEQDRKLLKFMNQRLLFDKATIERFLSKTVRDLEKSNIKLNDTIKKLSTRNSQLEEFGFITSHDLQEPLRTVRNYATLLQARYHDEFDELGQASLGFMLDATIRMQNLIRGLLDYSRIGREGAIEEVDCNVLVKKILDDVSFTVIESKSQIEVGKLPVIQAFKIDIVLLFQNLISNAMKFKCSSKVPQIQISATEDNDFWTFKVADNGIGIEKMHQTKIFEVFKRLHNRNDYVGTGIGLSHCKKIVELYGGKIWVESELGKGSEFYFTIAKKS